jgi:hypothetical protein
MNEENNLLVTISMNMVENCRQDNSLSMVASNDAVFQYLERSLSLLDRSFLLLESNTPDQIDGLNVKMNHDLELLCRLEGEMALITIMRGQFDVAEGHCERCLAYYGIEGENKTIFIFTALSTYCDLRERQGNYSDALIFADEDYSLLAEFYNLVHPSVQKAAGILIRIMIKRGGYKLAERFAKHTYESLAEIADETTYSASLDPFPSH